MKRIIALLALCCLLCGCKNESNEMEQAILMRQKLLNANSCSFDAGIKAEYSEKEYSFLLRCNCDKNGDISFIVIEPDSISNISGSISGNGGTFRFDDTVLAFETFANDTLSPIVAPWLMLHSLRGGYINHCASTNEGITLAINDTYRGSNLYMEVVLKKDGIPQGAEMYYEGKRILTVSVSNFEIL